MSKVAILEAIKRASVMYRNFVVAIRLNNVMLLEQPGMYVILGDGN